MFGTYALVAAGCGAIVVDDLTGSLGHVGVALTFGLVIAVMVAGTGHLSGAHLDPAVTLAFALMRHFPWNEVAAYVGAQLIGAVGGAITLRVLFGNVASLGATLPSGSAWQSFLLEILLTAALMFVIVAVATDTARSRPVGCACHRFHGPDKCHVGWPYQRRVHESSTFIWPSPCLRNLAGSMDLLGSPYHRRCPRSHYLSDIAHPRHRSSACSSANYGLTRTGKPTDHRRPLTMQQITIFGDIHGNLPRSKPHSQTWMYTGLGNRFCLGDLVGYGVFPNEVTELIRSGNYPTLMGNYDQGVGNSRDDCGCAYTKPEAEALGKLSHRLTNAHTADENKAFLRGLDSQFSVQLGDLRIVLVHGSPRRINEYLFEDRPDRSMERLLDMVDADVLVCGHTHMPYHRVLPSGRHVINAGSVGKPKDNDPRAAMSALSVQDNELSVVFHRVGYDIEQIALAIEASDMPSVYAQMLRDGEG